MRNAKVADVWRHVNDIEKYKTRILDISIENMSGFETVKITPQSAITALCGKNGVGKTTLLKFVFNAIKNNKRAMPKERFGNYTYKINIKNENTSFIIDGESDHFFNQIVYLEPSQECSRILEYIKKTKNFDEIIEGEGENIAFNDARVKCQIERIIGKQYKKISFREITGALEDDYVFPYFEIELSSGIKYSNVNMGMGEFSVFYILWFIRNCERNSIVFIEEPENFISANTQSYLMDKIAEQADVNKLWIMLSTHSEHILSRISLDNTKILQKRITDITHLVEPRYREKYLTALGLTPQLDGVIFVEDDFSAEFLTFLLSKLSPSFLKNHKVLPIRCDSNIEKIISHYEPQRKIPISFIGVFDADQQSKVLQYTGKDVYVAALPGIKSLPPEVLVWDTLYKEIVSVSVLLQVDQEILQNAVMNNITMNYHDRYSNVAEDLSISNEVLLQAIFTQWLVDEDNRNLADLFILSITNYNKIIPASINNVSVEGFCFNILGFEVKIKKENVIAPPNYPLIKGMNVKLHLYFESKEFIARVLNS
ncbi:AAA family ATPase [Pantoea agglomerans]|uniref:ATP-dependent nuclease n=1 Tax=Enterobacter agglomerans TaxID=549 RepID=UPI002A69E1EA|nr:AAA family ATPase [Pantoea agglomerans]MDY1000337.1 AAA family ATPase [Pantoea agglomerans]